MSFPLYIAIVNGKKKFHSSELERDIKSWEKDTKDETLRVKWQEISKAYENEILNQEIGSKYYIQLTKNLANITNMFGATRRISIIKTRQLKF